MHINKMHNNIIYIIHIFSVISACKKLASRSENNLEVEMDESVYFSKKVIDLLFYTGRYIPQKVTT